MLETARQRVQDGESVDSVVDDLYGQITARIDEDIEAEELAFESELDDTESEE